MGNARQAPHFLSIPKQKTNNSSLVLNLTWHTVTMAKNPQGHFEKKTINI
jgi:hypothetical protein